MSKLKVILGRLIYNLAWPGIYLYLNKSTRVRAVVKCGDKYVMVTQTIGHGDAGTPGGGVGKSEAVEQAAAREIEEETGLIVDASAMVYFGDSVGKTRSATFKVHYVGCKIDSLPDNYRPNHWWEVAEVLEVSLDRVLATVIDEDIRRKIGDWAEES